MYIIIIDHVSLSLLVSTEKMIRTLVTKHPLPLLLLLQLLQPLHFYQDYVDRENLKELQEELYGIGPMRPYSKERFERLSIIKHGRLMYDPNYCNQLIKERDIHDRKKCVKEHYFVTMQYSEMQSLCSSKFVPCKNGVKKCNKSSRLIDGLYCNLIGGNIVPYCQYESFHRQGYVLLTCQWNNDIEKLIPEKINDIMILFWP